ncbi:MAG: carboxylesterase family protein [Gammaproteobacteria bacterium]|nr:carboxylesterase family protein [Gammaproteobacteria bacterium]
MLRKIAIGLIVVLLLALVLIYFLSPDEEPVEEPILPEPTTTRLTTEGEYIGFLDANGSRAWLGLPFAAPPVEELRWVKPNQPEPHSGIKQAIAFGDPCVQFSNPTLRAHDETVVGVVGNEDCLYLNVWSPPNTIDAPVMFWIHGGGNSVGEAGTYNGSVIAATHKLVVVTTNYRLGLLGWFNHPDLLAVSEQSSGNFGTLDLIRALEWVRDNIRSFGGDPSNVTVFGESAGGFNTLALMASPQAKGLFHRAISQSGGFDVDDPAFGYMLKNEGGHANSAREIVNRLLIIDDLASDESEATALQGDWSPQELTEYLKSKPASEIYATLGTNGGFGMIDFPSGFGDDMVLPKETDEPLFANTSNYNAVPVILGTNRDEPTLFMLQQPEYTDTVLGIFPTLKDENDYRRVVYHGAQAWKARGVDQIAKVMQSGGHNDVYTYRFDWDEEASSIFFDLQVALGAGHAMEIPFVFGSFSGDNMLAGFYPNNEAQFALSKSMMSYWAEFAHTGNPARGRDGNEVEWTPFGENEQTSIIFDTAKDGGIRMMDELVTYETVREELVNDQSFNDNDLRCRTYIRNLREAPVYSEDDLSAMGCDHIDPAQVNW